MQTGTALDMMPPPALTPGKTPPRAASLWQWAWRMALLLLLMALLLADQTEGGLIGHWRESSAGLVESAEPWALAAAALVYALLLSLPFVPGLEAGLALMMVFGAPGAVVAYLGTLAGLSLAYGLGRHALPPRNLATLPNLETLSRSRLARWAAHLTRHPCLLLAALLNLPGNTLLGGGGGIALIFGLTRTVTWPRFLLTIALATAPVPLAFLLGWMSL